MHNNFIMKIPYYQFILLYYNLTSVTSFKYQQNSFKSSKIFEIISIWQICQIAFNVCFILQYPITLEFLFEHDAVDYKKVSMFSFIVMYFDNFSKQTVAAILISILFYKRRSFLHFLNKCQDQEITGNSKKRLIHKVQVNSAIAFIFGMFILIFCYYLLMKKSFIHFIICIFLVYPFVSFVSFCSFVKNSEAFLVELLCSFNEDLVQFLHKKNFDGVEYHRLVIRYQNIMEINEAFNKIFGTTLTLVICAILSMLTCHVSKLTVMSNAMLIWDYLVLSRSSDCDIISKLRLHSFHRSKSAT